MNMFRYADMHCHPNLKTFGHSFDKISSRKSDMWNCEPPSRYTKTIHQLTGLAKFSQTDLSSMVSAGARIVFLSLYPFEKGFFKNSFLPPRITAVLANWAIEIGYQRIRHLQRHRDYFKDLQAEYEFVVSNQKASVVGAATRTWRLVNNWTEVDNVHQQSNNIAVIITIEGAHVFNCGLSEFGVAADEKQIMANINTVKTWEFAPLFIGLAHNFSNELCGHAPSLQRLGRMVDQSKNLDTGITDLGRKVIHALLSNKNGKPIFIDLKHMSLLARQEYVVLLKSEYKDRSIPLIVSHGALTGRSFTGHVSKTGCLDIYNRGTLNFFDEEILAVARSGGLFGLQMDIGIHAEKKVLKSLMPKVSSQTDVSRCAKIIWNQIQHIASLLDAAGLPCWTTTAVGSDFDGSINPFPGVLTAGAFEPLSRELVLLAKEFLQQKTLAVAGNRALSAEKITDLFFFGNIEQFLKKNFI